MNSEFERFVFGDGVNEGPFQPTAYYDPDGDCIEFIASDETFRAERLDQLVTVYIGRESGEVVGSLIKGVSRYIHEVLESYPGFKIEIQDGRRIKLEHLFAFQLTEAYRDPEGTKVVIYRKLHDVAKQSKANVDVTPVAA